jgi:dienelactone hydrolase
MVKEARGGPVADRCEILHGPPDDLEEGTPAAAARGRRRGMRLSRACFAIFLALLLARWPAQAFETAATGGLPLRVLRSEAAAPAPTVLLAHGCAGPAKERDDPFARELAFRGFNAVQFDSWTFRGLPGGVCATNAVHAEQRLADLRLAIAWVREQPWHHGDIHLVGWSHGGILALHASTQDPALGLSRVVAFYPWCERYYGDPKVPTQIHMGEKDDWTPAWRCRSLYRGLLGHHPLGEYVEYPGAYHGFDRADGADVLVSGMGEYGMVSKRRIKADPAQRSAAYRRVVEFLRPQ